MNRNISGPPGKASTQVICSITGCTASAAATGIGGGAGGHVHTTGSGTTDTIGDGGCGQPSACDTPPGS